MITSFFLSPCLILSTPTHSWYKCLPFILLSHFFWHFFLVCWFQLYLLMPFQLVICFGAFFANLLPHFLPHLHALTTKGNLLWAITALFCTDCVIFHISYCVADFPLKSSHWVRTFFQSFSVYLFNPLLSQKDGK